MVGVAISFAGPLVWLALWKHLQKGTQVPWTVLPMLGIVALSWRYLSGWGWPSATSEGRRRALRAFWPSAGTTPLTLVSVVAIAFCAVSAVIVGLRLGRFPAEDFAPSQALLALPPVLAWSKVMMISLAAGFFEEAGFRGYLQSALEGRLRPTLAIALTSLLFWAIHLGHGWATGDLIQTLAIAVPFFVASAFLGALAYVTNTIGPGMVAHTIMDAVLLPLQWGLAGSYNVMPLEESGVDRHFVVWSSVLVCSAAVSVYALVGLSRTRASQPRLSPAPKRAKMTG